MGRTAFAYVYVHALFVTFQHGSSIGTFMVVAYSCGYIRIQHSGWHPDRMPVDSASLEQGKFFHHFRIFIRNGIKIHDFSQTYNALVIKKLFHAGSREFPCSVRVQAGCRHTRWYYCVNADSRLVRFVQETPQSPCARHIDDFVRVGYHGRRALAHHGT